MDHGAAATSSQIQHWPGQRLSRRDDETFVLRGESTWTEPPAWIYVFDVEADSTQHPNPLSIKTRIGTDAESLAHYAFKVVPDAAVAAGGSADRILLSLRKRLGNWLARVS